MAEDYYKVLGVGRDASQADIQKAYRALARKHHPDLNPDDKNAKKRFQEIQAAFDVLNDTQKREMYDRYGDAFESAAAGGGPQPGGTWTFNAGSGGFEDIDLSQVFGDRGDDAGGGFADIFSQFRRGRGATTRRAGSARSARGDDLAYDIEIPFTMAVLGGSADLAMRRPSGEVETISVRITPGIDDGQKIRLRGQGSPSLSGRPSGDAIVTVRVKPHPYFSRRGDNLYVKVPVTVREAAEGAKVDVPTPTGVVTLKVPPCMSSGTRLKVRGHGVAPLGRSPGDLFAEIHIMLPKTLDSASLGLVRKLDERNRQEPRQDLRW